MNVQPNITHLLYLHGFRSSPQSFKAKVFGRHVATHWPNINWWCPQLPPSPREAMDLVAQGIANWPRGQMAVVGSSLGGFYATWVAEHNGCSAVLLNPAVNPARDLAKYIGEQTSWHDPQERFFFRTEFVGELQNLTCGALTRPQRHMAIIAKGDEVLDWREMYARYADCHTTVLEGGDHAISDFENHVPAICSFLGLR